MLIKNLKSFIGAGLLLLAVQESRAFSLLGEEEPWMTPEINYQQGGRDMGGWMNIGNEYRWNTPYLTYGFDSSFIEYFGARGVQAVEEAIGVLNALPPASQLNLDDYPLEGHRVNFRAESLSLMDVKSLALFFLLEEMGLADPTIGVWRLRDRDIPVPGFTNYTVIQRNFDPYTFSPTAYINGILYTYDTIVDIQPPGPGAYPRVVPLDPTVSPYAGPIASRRPRQRGYYYTGLTRDDVGGLRYMLRTNNYNVEELLPDVRVVSTNSLTPVQLKTLDLAELIRNSVDTTNTVAQLLASNTNYNDLWITATNARLGSIITTNRFTYFINYPANPQQVIEETYETNFVTLYTYEFGNVVLYSEYSDRPIFVSVMDIVPAMDYTPGLPNYRTNLIDQYFDTEVIRNGEFYIMPTNVVRFSPSLSEIEPSAINVVTTTNVDFFAEALWTIRTNTAQLELLQTIDLATFSEEARTNNPAALQGLYPDLLILSSNRFFTNIVTSNYVAFLTNNAWDPGVIWSIGYEWSFTTNVATNYSYTFGNVVTNFGDSSSVLDSSSIIVEETILAPNPYDPAGSPFVTNVVRTEVFTNVPVGNVYIVPTNLFGYAILSTQLVDVVSVTNTAEFINLVPGTVEQTNTVNYIRYETNYYLNAYPIEFVNTNDLATNIFGIRREVVSFSTNRIFEVYPVELLSPTNSIGLRPGVDKINFVRVFQDSLIGPTFKPITNEYVDTVIISNTPVSQIVRRTSARPDFLFTAEDLLTAIASRTVAWDNNDALNGQAGSGGPGNIQPQVQITFNSAYPIYQNYNAGTNFFFLSEPGFGTDSIAYGSFDGSTNEPVIYPSGTSITDLENQILNGN